MILEFGHFLEKEDAQGEVIAESRWQDDDAVLRAFVSATNESTYQRRTRYKSWARSSFKRIHSLTFQNKKGLSFGLEIADLFGWAHFNKEFGIKHPVRTIQQKQRIENRISKIDTKLRNLYKKNKPELITRSKISYIASDRVSKFTKALKEYRGGTLVFFGDPTR